MPLSNISGVVVSAYLWFQYYSSRSTVELKMDKVNAAKTSVDAVKVHHETKLSFKVGDKVLKTVTLSVPYAYTCARAYAYSLDLDHTAQKMQCDFI